jgi:uncharacterized membrane protein
MRPQLPEREAATGVLSRCGFYALAACTMLAGTFLAARFFFTRSIHHGHLAWNMLLAWVPYVCSIVLLCLADRAGAPQRCPWRRSLIAAVALIWLGFFPNAPYLVTDFVHLTPSASLAWWYDIGLIATFAWTGFMLAIVSLSIVQELVTRRYGSARGWMVAIATIVLSSAGIYIGRFVRLNSWDVVIKPLRVGGILWEGIARGHATSPRTLGVTMMFSAMLLMFYMTWRSARPEMAR